MVPLMPPDASSFALGVNQVSTAALLASVCWEIVVKWIRPFVAVSAEIFAVPAATLAAEWLVVAEVTEQFDIALIFVSIDSRWLLFCDEPESLSDVRSADACSRETNRPDGVAFSFHVIANKVEPPVGNRAFNLLTKEDWRAALADEVIPRWPKMAGIGAAIFGTRRTEGLTRTTARPNRSVIGPSGKSEGVTPTADPGKEVALGEASQVVRVKGLDVTLVYLSIRDQAVGDQFPQPCRRKRIMLVVVGTHARFRSTKRVGLAGATGLRDRGRSGSTILLSPQPEQTSTMRPLRSRSRRRSPWPNQQVEFRRFKNFIQFIVRASGDLVSALPPWALRATSHGTDSTAPARPAASRLLGQPTDRPAS